MSPVTEERDLLNIAESAQRVAHAEETSSAARAGDDTVRKTHESVSIKRQVDLIVTGGIADSGILCPFEMNPEANSKEWTTVPTLALLKLTTAGPGRSVMPMKLGDGLI